MKLTTIYLDSLSSPSSTITISINYKDTIFKWENLTSIIGKTTFEKLHKLQNKIKANTKAVYSNLGRGTHGHISLVLADVQYTCILNVPFVYRTQLGPLIIPDGTTVHANSNMRTPNKCSFSRIDGVLESPCAKNRCHSQGGIYFGYPQLHNELHQWHRGVCAHSPPIKLKLVYASQTPWAQVHCQ